MINTVVTNTLLQFTVLITTVVTNTLLQFTVLVTTEVTNTLPQYYIVVVTKLVASMLLLLMCTTLRHGVRTQLTHDS